jgi:hypothetical protein
MAPVRPDGLIEAEGGGVGFLLLAQVVLQVMKENSNKNAFTQCEDIQEPTTAAV